MMKFVNSKQKIAAFLIGLVALVTVLAEVAFRTELRMSQGEPFYMATWTSFFYFTIWTNTLLGVVLVMVGRGLFDFQSARLQSLMTFLTTQIFIVGLVYHFLLRHVFHPEGIFKITDHFLHIVIPISMFLYWLFCVSKDRLTFLEPLKWLSFLLVYGVYAFTRGALSDQYPYPFINVNLIGIEQTVINSIGMIIAFYLVGALLVLLAKGLLKFQKN